MIKRPAQHTALTFLRLSKLSVTFLLVMVLLYPILLLVGVGIKVGVVLGIHFILERLFGTWIFLSFMAIVTFLFLGLSFLSRVKELGRYYIGLNHVRLSSIQKCWYKVVFAIDFIVTDMLMLTASFILAYVYWTSAQLGSYDPFYAFLQPFLALSILGGLLQILFSSYYLTHDKLHPVYIRAVHAGKSYDRITRPSNTIAMSRPLVRETRARSSSRKTKRKSTRKAAKKRKVTKRKTTKKRTVKRKAPKRRVTKRKTVKRKAARRTTRKKSSRKKSSRRR